MRCLIDIFLDSAKKNPHAPALWVAETYFSYLELLEFAVPLSEKLKRSQHHYCLLLSDRSLMAYVGLLACLIAKKIIVPIYLKSSIAKIIEITEQLEDCDIIFDRVNFPIVNALKSVSTHAEWNLYTLDIPIHEEIQNSTLQHQFHLISKSPLKEVPLIHPHSHPLPIILLFTSGSTGNPKGIIMRESSIVNYVDSLKKLMTLTPDDRCSHITEFTFDSSIHEIFNCWAAGACLYRYTGSYIWDLSNFIRHQKITVITLVPSTAILLKQFHCLTPEKLSTLKITMFGGEPLSTNIVKSWLIAAPSTSIFNIYGATETTIGLCVYTWKGTEHDDVKFLPIGKVFTNQEILILKEDLTQTTHNEAGELYISGSQVNLGYFKNANATALQFITLPHSNEKIWYKTGDIVFLNRKKDLEFIGRADDQFKIRGYRVEKYEVEQAFKEILQTDAIAVTPIKDQNNTIQGLTLFCLISEKMSDQAIRENAKIKLPDYMIPTKIMRVKNFPLTSSGKIAYTELREIS